MQRSGKRKQDEELRADTAPAAPAGALLDLDPHRARDRRCEIAGKIRRVIRHCVSADYGRIDGVSDDDA